MAAGLQTSEDELEGIQSAWRGLLSEVMEGEEKAVRPGAVCLVTEKRMAFRGGGRGKLGSARGPANGAGACACLFGPAFECCSVHEQGMLDIIHARSSGTKLSWRI